MDSIIEECTNNHISLLKVILLFMDEDIVFNENIDIIGLNDIFNNITDYDFKDSNKIIDEDVNNDDEEDEDEDYEENDEEENDEEEEVK